MNRLIKDGLKVWEGNLSRDIRDNLKKFVIEKQVEGCFELPLAAQQSLQAEHIGGVIALGCLIRGETAHFEMIARACIDGLMRVSLDMNKPIGLGVITCENKSQAKERSGVGEE